MANIDIELSAIQNAQYGEEVRKSIVDALREMNTEASAAHDWAVGPEGSGPASDTNNAKYYSDLASETVSSKADASTVNNAIADLAASVAGKQDALTFDTIPTANSVNPVISGGVYTALQPDTTLSVSGKAADAAATGTAVANLAASTWKLTNVDRVKDGSDYNDLTDPGVYRVASASEASGMTNCPTTQAHRLVVQALVGGTTRLQIIYTNANRVYFRASDSNGWKDWSEFARGADVAAVAAVLAGKQDALTFDTTPTENSANPVTSGGVYTALQPDTTLSVSGKAAEAAIVGSRLSRVFDLATGNATAIGEDADINSYRTPGNYKIASASIAATVSNLPVSAAGRLIVATTFHTSRFIQIWLTENNGTIAYRYGTDTNWHSWHKVQDVETMEAVLAGKQDALTFDTTPTENSANPVTSGGVYTALQPDTTLSVSGKAAEAAIVGSRLSRVFDLATGNATAIGEDADINSYRTPGNYKIASASIAATVSNLPVSAAGRLIVATTFHTSRFIQIWLTATGATIAYRYGDNSSWSSWNIVNQVNLPDNGETVLILGDSWADEATSGATKWPTYFAKSVKSDIKNYAKNGASVYGADDYSTNGTIGGQVAAAIEDTSYVHDTVSTIFLMGGLNDYRAGRTAANAALAWASLITRLQTGFPNARIVVCLNNQIFVDADQLSYLRDCALEIRKLGIPCYTMLGWFPASMYNSDHIHPSATAHGIIAGNMLALYRGGPVNYMQNQYTVSNPGSGITALTVTEFFSDSRITRRFEVAKSATAAAAAQALTIQNTAGLALNVPFAAMLGKMAADAEFIFAAGTSPASSEESHKMASTNELTITLPVTGAGTYAAETAV